MADVTVDVTYNINNKTASYSIDGRASNGDVTADYGDNTLTWNASGNAGRWKFTGIQITPANSGFSTSTSDNSVVVDDDDTNESGFDQQYSYQLQIEIITTRETRYLDPQIINKSKPVHS